MIANKITQNLEKSSWIRKMFEEGARLKQIHGTDNVFDFTLGNPGPQPQQQVLDAIAKYVKTENVHKYMPNAGFPDVREKLADFFNKKSETKVTAKNIIMTVGAAGGLNVVLKGLLNPDEEVIVLAPYFSEYLFYIQNHNGVAKVVQTKQDSFQLDVDSIAQALTKNTKAIIVNSPNNPTGVIYSASDLRSLADVLSKYEKQNNTQIALISDEPYNQISYGKEVPNIMDIYHNTIIVNSMSKSMSLPGGRIGYIIVSPTFSSFDEAMAAFAFTNRTLGYVNAPSLYQKAIADVIDVPADVEYYDSHRVLLTALMDECGFEYIEPEGAFYLFLKCPIEDDVEFTNIAAKYNILVVPGRGFGAPGYVRLAFCGDINTIINAREVFLELAGEFK